MWHPGSAVLRSDFDPEVIPTAKATADFFRVLGVTAQLGRVVGVMPQGFAMPSDKTETWVPWDGRGSDLPNDPAEPEAILGLLFLYHRARGRLSGGQA